jgi:hypothetical protein
MRGRMPDSFVDQPRRPADPRDGDPLEIAVGLVPGEEDLIDTLEAPVVGAVVQGDPASASDSDAAADIAAAPEEMAAGDEQQEGPGHDADED